MNVLLFSRPICSYLFSYYFIDDMGSRLTSFDVLWKIELVTMVDVDVYLLFAAQTIFRVQLRRLTCREIITAAR